ncbi:hypothetical protein ACFPRL_05525 [Pseudoclavibacter helvolus]
MAPSCGFVSGKEGVDMCGSFRHHRACRPGLWPSYGEAVAQLRPEIACTLTRTFTTVPAGSTASAAVLIRAASPSTI